MAHFLTLTLGATLLAAQAGKTLEKVTWLSGHMVALRTIDPNDPDFADLRPLGKAIGNARVVLLGGGRDRYTVEAKFRLVRFLHEQMGFDVLGLLTPICEPALLDLTLDRRGTLDPMLGPILASRFEYAGESDRLYTDLSVLDYVRHTHKSAHPLHLGGFGWGFVPGLISVYEKEIFRVVDAVDPNLASPAERKAIRALVHVGDPQNYAKPRDMQKALPGGLAAVASLSAALGRLPPDNPHAREILFCRIFLANLASGASRHTSQPEPAPKPDTVVSFAAELHPGARVVVWADNQTTQRNSTRALFGDAAFAIAFTAIQDDYGILQVLDAGSGNQLAPAGDDLESLVHSVGYRYSFLDWRNLPPEHWLRQPLSARMVHGIEIADWPSRYDALLTIDLAAATKRKE